MSTPKKAPAKKAAAPAKKSAPKNPEPDKQPGIGPKLDSPPSATIPPNPNKATVKMNVSYTHTLTDAEQRSRSTLYFEKIEKIEVIEAQMKAAVSQFKDTIARLQAEAKELSGPARSGIEQRTTLCIIELDTTNNVRMCYECRPDGSKGPFIIELPMQREDYETVLQFEQDWRNECEEKEAKARAEQELQKLEEEEKQSGSGAESKETTGDTDTSSGASSENSGE